MDHYQHGGVVVKYKNVNDHGITTLDDNKIRKLLKTLTKEFQGALSIKLGRFTCHPAKTGVIIKRTCGKSIFILSKASSGTQKIKIICRSEVIRNLVMQFLRNYRGITLVFESEIAS